MSHTPAPIVVGLDDSASSAAALRFALQEALRRGSPLDVVTAWMSRAVADLAVPENPRESARARAQKMQDAAVAASLEEYDGPSILSRRIVEGDAAQVLLRLARRADYLVVGTGRMEPTKRTLLGSVSAHCVRHARCPVLVVPSLSDVFETRDLIQSA